MKITRVGATMQITLTVPDDVAAQAHALGVSVEDHVQSLLEKVRLEEQRPAHARTREEIQAFFKSMAEASERLPHLSTASFTRESFYEDGR